MTVKLLNPEFYLDRIPIRIDFVEIWAAGTFSLALATAASWFAARRTGKLQPLAIMRKH